MASAALGTAYRHLRDLFAAGSVVGLEDGQLLSRYSRSNDPAAFEALVSRHGPMVLATCRAVLKNEHDAEDAFQATFLVLAKKAHSVRGSEALGGWLHRVAYRASVQASVQARKRRRKEAEASAMAPLDASPSVPSLDHELRPILHEEIDRLPESHRQAVVLCDLEGLTYEQAAEQLQWTVPTLRCRLAKARQRLKGRLARRGLTPQVVGPFLVPKAATAIVPPALLKATVLAATGGAASAGALLLTHTLLRGMLMTKIKIAGTAALSAFALATAGVIAFGGGRPAEDTKPAMPSKLEAKTEIAAQEAPAGKKPMEMVEVKGRVVAPDGKPVVGATIQPTYMDRETRPLPKATSGADGRFSIRLARPKVNDPSGYTARFPWLLAWAPGYGLGWTERALRSDRPDELVVKLVEEGPPIEGRIVDLEGRAVANAKIEAARIWFEAKGDLPGWIAKARNGAVGNLWQGLENLPLDPLVRPEWNAPPERLAMIATTSDLDGRFKLTGVGRDRIAELILSGSGISTTMLEVFSRPEPEIRSVDKGMMRAEAFLVHAPKFDIPVAPGQRVEGIVRDQDTGQPIAGLEIKAAAFDEYSMIWAPGIESRTDAEGRYRLDGLPLAAAYRLFLTPDPGIPYTKAILKAPGGSPAREPVAFDFKLKRGIMVRGRVTDLVTGRNVRGYPSYYAFSDNPYLKDYPGFSQSYESYTNFKEDGSYELVALPGRGLIAVRAEQDRHKSAAGAEKIQGYDSKNNQFPTVPRPVFVRSTNIIAELNLDPKAESATLDLQADPGISLAIEVVDPTGQPIGGTKVKGKAELFQTGAFDEESSRFEVNALDPSKPRRVIISHEGRKLIGSVYLKGTETGPITVKLQAWGAITGRIVDEEGKPRKGMFLGDYGMTLKSEPETRDILPGADWNSGLRAGDDGRFVVEGLVPGLKYHATGRAGMMDRGGDLFDGLITNSGEVKDLGDIRVQPPKNEEN